MELTLFSFQPSKSLLSRIPPGIKLLGLLASTLLLFQVNLGTAAILCPAVALFATVMGFSPSSQLRDFRPILLYLLLYYLVAVVSDPMQQGGLSVRTLIPSDKILLSILRLLLSVQLASLLYKSTTASQLRFSLHRAESALRRTIRSIPLVGSKISPQATATLSLTLVISFIPRLLALWNQLELSWKARGGKPGPGMVGILLPQLVSLAFQDAEDTWRAMASREAAQKATQDNQGNQLC